MSDPRSQPRVILDPPILLRRDGFEWLFDPQLRNGIVIAQGLQAALQRQDTAALRVFNARLTADFILEFRALSLDLVSYSHRDATDLPQRGQGIIQALLAEGPAGEIYADEYAYLVTHSWMGARQKARKTLEAFQRAGVQVVLVPTARLQAFLRTAHASIPPRVMDALKTAGHAIDNNLLVAAGGVAVAAVPELALPTALAATASAGAAMIAGDP